MDASLAVILERPGSISAGRPEMSYYPGGMSGQFDIWESFAYEIPPQISFEEAYKVILYPELP